MKYISIVLVLIFFCSCEEKMVVIPERDDIISDRVVLLEEFTGVTCPNCPKGSAEVEILLNRYPENLVVVGVHSNFLAAPVQGESLYDFRTPEAQEIENLLGGWFAKPEGALNRVLFPGESNIRVDVDDWDGYIQEELAKAPKTFIELDKTYDAASRLLDITVRLVPQEAVSGEVRVVVYITEGGIVDLQEDTGGFIEEFDHEHVLRKSLTDVAGDNIANGLSVGNNVEKSYSYTLPPEDGLWVDNNCEIVAFAVLITDTSKEVMQAAEAHVVD